MKNPKGEFVSTKPWQTARWKKRRAEVIKDSCEICGATADERTLCIHHHTVFPGEEGFERYMMMLESDIQTLCKGCHTNVERGLVRCSNCERRWHKPQYPTCWDCSGKKDEWDEEQALETVWDVTSSLMRWECDCAVECDRESFRVLGEDDEEVDAGELLACAVTELQRRFGARVKTGSTARRPASD